MLQRVVDALIVQSCMSLDEERALLFSIARGLNNVAPGDKAPMGADLEHRYYIERARESCANNAYCKQFKCTAFEFLTLHTKASDMDALQAIKRYQKDPVSFGRKLSYSEFMRRLSNVNQTDVDLYVERLCMGKAQIVPIDAENVVLGKPLDQRVMDTAAVKKLMAADDSALLDAKPLPSAPSLKEATPSTEHQLSPPDPPKAP